MDRLDANSAYWYSLVVVGAALLSAYDTFVTTADTAVMYIFGYVFGTAVLTGGIIWSARIGVAWLPQRLTPTISARAISLAFVVAYAYVGFNASWFTEASLWLVGWLYALLLIALISLIRLGWHGVTVVRAKS